MDNKLSPEQRRENYKRKVSVCGYCEVEEGYWPGYQRPDNWITSGFDTNEFSKTSLDFCSRECIKDYISSGAIGHGLTDGLERMSMQDEEYNKQDASGGNSE